jgi:hypothetical protein
MLRRPINRILLAFLCSVAICWVDFLIQTRLPREGPHSTFEDSWWYRAWNWTLPLEGQRDLGFALYTAVAIAGATVIFYIVFTCWERRRSLKRRV